MIDGPPVRHIRPLAVALLAGWLGACATPPATSHLLSQTDGVPSRAEVLDVPFHPQEDHYCGPAALAMMLGWSGKAVTTEELISQVYTPGREGTLHADILTAARRHGRLAVPVRSLGDILVELAAGHPVLVFENLGLEWYPQWHYAVAVAYDLSREQITLRSGDEARHTIALSTFERVWDRGRGGRLSCCRPTVCPRGPTRWSCLTPQPASNAWAIPKPPPRPTRPHWASGRICWRAGSA